MYRVARKYLMRAATLLLVVACGNGVTSDLGLSADLRVAGGQFVAGSTPEDTSGPHVESLELLSTNIWPGYRDKALRGSAASPTTAFSLGLRGDSGYWIVPAGAADNSAPTFPTFRGLVSFSATLPLGRHELEVRAVDVGGHFGPVWRQELNATSGPLRNGGLPALVVALRWDTESDLDLHVVDPKLQEIYHAAPTSLDGFTPSAIKDAAFGALDADSNADCQIDGRRREQVVWSDLPVPGRYWVRVDTKSLCAEAIAHYQVEVLLNGEAIASSTGVALDSDTWGPHDRGAGVLALGFDIP
jgi:hypothetical protein